MQAEGRNIFNELGREWWGRSRRILEPILVVGILGDYNSCEEEKSEGFVLMLAERCMVNS